MNSRHQIIAGLEQELHGIVTRPGGFMFEDAERAICRAAAEISGLEPEMIDEAARDAFRASTAVALCRFAELAAKDA